MITLLLHLLRLLPFLCGGHRHLALENLALRHQVAVYKRIVTRPRLRRIDRFFWVGLARVWAGWRRPLFIVTPDTVLRWQRRRFREHWTKVSGRPTRGRPPVNAEIKVLIMRMAAANPLWGAPRIHGELLAQGEVLQGELAVAAAEEREEAKQVEQESDHRAEIVAESEADSSPTCPPAKFWRRTGMQSPGFGGR